MPTRLVLLCATRFVERHESVLVAKELLPYVAISLSDMAEWDTEDTRKSANSLLYSIKSPAFLIGLIMLEIVSGIMKPVSAKLQTIGKDLVGALEDIEVMHKLLK